MYVILDSKNNILTPNDNILPYRYVEYGSIIKLMIGGVYFNDGLTK